MSKNLQPQISEKSQLWKKLIRRIFYFILVMFILPIMLIPLTLNSTVAIEQSNYFNYALLVATIIGLVLITMTLLGITPIMLQLLDIRKKEKEESEDIGMFP